LPLTVLDGSTFCVCDERGDVDGLATASGFFASDTRFLSRSVLTLGGARLDPLSHDHSTPQLASFVLRNPLAGGLRPNELVIERERFVGDCMEERIVVENHSQRRIDVELALELAADFADIFVVKDLEPGFGRPVEVTLPEARPPQPVLLHHDPHLQADADDALPLDYAHVRPQAAGERIPEHD
jgi:glycogen debranching enzyme